MFKVDRAKAAGFLFFAVSLWLFTRGLDIHGLEYRDDEIFYFQSTREMIRSGDYLSPTYFGEDRFQKPILFYWLVLLSYKVFGVNWAGARWVAALFGAASVLLTWLTARQLFTDRRIAHVSAVILMTVPLFFRHAKNAVPDMPLNFFIVAAMYCAVRFLRSPEDKKNSVFFFLFCALGFMIKGFAAVVVPVLVFLAFVLIHKKIRLLKEINVGRGLGILVAVILPWFLYMAVAHGVSYMEYMLVQETKNRLLGEASVAPMFFLEHTVFYLRTILSYFAPWSVFFFWAVALAFLRQRTDSQRAESLRWLLLWTVVVVVFFSSMYFTINHYMLVLSTPFAILVSFLFLEGFSPGAAEGRAASFLRKSLVIFILTAGWAAFGFLAVFLAGMAKGWLAVFGVVYGFLIVLIARSRSLATAPLTLGIFLIGVFAQSGLMDKAGLTAHSALRQFAQAIPKDQNHPVVIGVGSHDIHEKEFQVYFDSRVEKAAASEEAQTKAGLANLFAAPQTVYCLMTAQDFERYFPSRDSVFPGVVHEGYIFRKRMHLDEGFFTALAQLDRRKVRDYLMEKLVLIKKERNA